MSRAALYRAVSETKSRASHPFRIRGADCGGAIIDAMIRDCVPRPVSRNVMVSIVSMIPIYRAPIWLPKVACLDLHYEALRSRCASAG